VRLGRALQLSEKGQLRDSIGTCYNYSAYMSITTIPYECQRNPTLLTMARLSNSSQSLSPRLRLALESSTHVRPS
jgi:hypothetical protein